jgi:fucose permease
MTPVNFGKKYSAAAIGLQMASAYVGTTFMPMVFGLLQQHVGMAIMPIYLLIFAVLNITLLEVAYRKADANK